MTRSALELAQVHQRKIRIADILQSALQPAIPIKIPGLDLVDGLTDLLKNGSALSAEQLMHDIVGGAQRHASGMFTDDVCLLVGIVGDRD